MKKLLVSVLSLVLVIGISFACYAATADTNIVINGTAVEFTDGTGFPYLDENNRTLVPLRVTMEAAGATVGYDSAKQTAIVVSGQDRIEVPIGTNFLYHNNIKVQNDTNSVVKDGRTYLPIRPVLESANFSVEWDNATKTVKAQNPNLNSNPQPYTGNDLNTAIYTNTNPAPETSVTQKPAQPEQVTSEQTAKLVYITDTGNKYHKASCRTIENSANVTEISLEEAKNLGYEACKICKPY